MVKRKTETAASAHKGRIYLQQHKQTRKAVLGDKLEQKVDGVGGECIS